ncbi:Phototropin-2, partial [Taenia solium]
MESEKPDIVKFISDESCPTAYEVVHTQGDDKNVTMSRALKPIHLQNDSAVQCFAQAHCIPQRSPFPCTQLQSFPIHRSPTLVLCDENGIDVRKLISNVSFLNDNGARFYSCEITCGLERLHVMGIVSLDVKSNSMHPTESGHLFFIIADSSCKMTRRRGLPNKTDFTDTAFLMAPEVKDQVGITARVDIWSVDIRAALSMYGRNTMRGRTRTGRHMKSCSSHVPKPLKSFIKTCLRHNPNRRLNADDGR